MREIRARKRKRKWLFRDYVRDALTLSGREENMADAGPRMVDLGEAAFFVPEM